MRFPFAACGQAEKKRKLREAFEADVEESVSAYEAELAKTAEAFEAEANKVAKKIRSDLKKRIDAVEAQEREQTKVVFIDADKLIVDVKKQRQRVAEAPIGTAVSQIVTLHEEKLEKIIKETSTRVADINACEACMADIKARQCGRHQGPTTWPTSWPTKRT